MSLLSNNDRMNTQNERSSRSSVKQLNWRHQVVANPAAQLSQYDCLEKLWIGPNVDPSIVYALPTDSLVTLDWDMTDDAGSSNGGGVLVNDGALEALLQHPSIRSLCLRFRGDSVVLSLAKYLHLSPRQRLESLDLRGNQISDVGATALAEALLRSSNDDDQHDDEEVSSSPPSSSSSSLRSLHLGYNRVGDQGIRALSRVLKDPRCRLESLDLSCNGIEDVTILTQVLQHNRTLTHLNLFGNPLTRSSTTLYQDFLYAIRDCNNDVIEVIKLPADGRASQQRPQKHLRHWLGLNKAGRRLLSLQHSLPMGAWAHVLDVKRQTPETLFYFTKQLPHLFR